VVTSWVNALVEFYAAGDIFSSYSNVQAWLERGRLRPRPHNRLSVLYLMRWSLPPSQYYAEDRLSFGEPSWKTLRLLVSIWVRTLSIFIVRIIVEGRLP
jgi:hypothetical protein